MVYNERRFRNDHIHCYSLCKNDAGHESARADLGWGIDTARRHCWRSCLAKDSARVAENIRSADFAYNSGFGSTGKVLINHISSLALRLTLHRVLLFQIPLWGMLALNTSIELLLLACYFGELRRFTIFAAKPARLMHNSRWSVWSPTILRSRLL